MNRTVVVLLSMILAANIFLPPAAAEGTSLPLVVQSKYFTINAPAGMNLDLFLEKLHYEHFLRPDDIFQAGSRDIHTLLGRTLDSILLEVADLLDIHEYEYKGTITIVSGQEDIDGLSRSYYDRPCREASLYVAQTNTIYLAEDQLSLWTLTDQLSQALIANYFTVPPPSTVRQALCGYVHFHVQKVTGQAHP